MTYQISCPYCRRRGDACVKHGGERAGPNRKAQLKRGVPPPKPPFPNPYECSLCEQKEELCDTHERIERNKSSRPPKPATTSVTTTEKTVDQHRIVQVKVGEVLITVKEPIK